MNNFTLDLYTMLQDPNFKLFNFDYKFYCEDPEIKKDFEDRFIEKYRFYEINNPIPYRFKLELQARLNEKHTYYRKLYETEIATKDTDFLSNKFYDETQTRENTKTATENINGSNNETINSNTTATNNLNLDSKESSLANGVAAADLSSGSLTKVSNDKNTGTVKNDGSSTSNSDNEQTRQNTATDKETFTIHGKGSIGVVTNDTMLKGWRSILLDINKQLIDDCRSLFLYVY